MTASSNKGRRAVIIGLDGTPYSFISGQIENGQLPNVAGIASGGILSKMKSEIPTISSVAWASFMTGKNPGEHGIYGFTGRKPGTYDLYFPNYEHLREAPFWARLGSDGKRCCIINVPSTYPAKPLNGLLVAGFVAPNLERATYPAEAFEYLQKIGYRIDVDASKGHKSLDLLLEDLHDTLEKRREAMFHFWNQERWDLFVNVFTGTDRLHHFMWRQFEAGDSAYASEFIKYYRRLDEIIGEFLEMLDESVSVFMLSDHGFCSIKREVYLNNFLEEWGYLSLAGEEPRTISDLDPAGTRAYCMDPGRLYLNLAGREPRGTVSDGEAAALLVEISEAVTAIADPGTGEAVVERVYRREELFSGPCEDLAPDLVVMPRDGYDLKGAIGRPSGFGETSITGMHTYDDAFWLAAEPSESAKAVSSIRDVAGAVSAIWTG